MNNNMNNNMMNNINNNMMNKNSNITGDMLYNLFDPSLLNNTNNPQQTIEQNNQNQSSAPKPDPFSNLMNLMK